MEIHLIGDNKYNVEDGIVVVRCHIERFKGFSQLWIDEIKIFGTIESSELVIRLKKIRKWFKEKKMINW